MFERFTSAARSVVVQAQREARVLHHDYVGTEHVLLGLLACGGGAAEALRSCGLTADAARAHVRRLVGEPALGDADADALRAIGIDLHAVRSLVEGAFGPGALERRRERRRGRRRGARGRCAPVGHIPFTPRAKKVLELSLREALRLRHRWIGPEHILLGLLREGQGLGMQVLDERRISIQDVRRRMLDELGSAA